MIKLFDEAKEDFKGHKKEVKQLESMSKLLNEVELGLDTEDVNHILVRNSIEKYIEETTGITVIWKRRFVYQMYHSNGKEYFLDVLTNELKPKKDIY